MAVRPTTDQKARIRREAALLFARNGYRGTGVQELSEAVGLGRGALYHHIGSKEDLLFEIVTLHVLDVVDDARAAAAARLPPEETVRELSRLTMATIVDHLPEWTVFFRDLNALAPPRRREALAARKAFEEVWLGVLARGAREGAFRPLDPVVAKGILGMHNWSHVWMTSGGRLPADEIARQFSDVIIGGIRA